MYLVIMEDKAGKKMHLGRGRARPVLMGCWHSSPSAATKALVSFIDKNPNTEYSLAIVKVKAGVIQS